jgi:catechol 2,3-dioxygenase-like lactoylglutathione lyase family enzyme
MSLTLGPVHHIRLTVTDLERSKAFYTGVLGFQVAMDTLPPEDDQFTTSSSRTCRAASCS